MICQSRTVLGEEGLLRHWCCLQPETRSLVTRACTRLQIVYAVRSVGCSGKTPAFPSEVLPPCLPVAVWLCTGWVNTASSAAGVEGLGGLREAT